MRESTLKTSVLVRLVIIGALAIVLLIPTIFVSLLVADRQTSRSFAIREVTSKWATAQTVVGPILTLPVTRMVKDKEGELHPRTVLVRILPEKLDVTARITPEIRTRGIYEVVLYTARLTLHADFASIHKEAESLAKGDIQWDGATISVGISDLKGIKEFRSLTWDNQPAHAEAGSRDTQPVASAVTVRPKVNPASDRHRFTMELDLKGSEEFRIVPTGRETRLTADARWSDPSFIGDFLPESRALSQESFTASWRVLDFNRNLPQSWVGDEPALASSSFGVRLLLPVDEYQQTQRALKYAIMFIALTFLAFFVLDVMTKSPFHPVQYALVGFALVLFYVLVLSVSEYLAFSVSYWIASAAIVALITLYTRGITPRTGNALRIGSVLTVLYAFLYVLLQLEDYALLIGSIGLFIILGIVMFLSRRLDWFSLGTAAEKPDPKSPSSMP